MTSMLEKSDESYVFSRSDCISHFSPPVLFDISLCLEFSNGDFHIDFLKKLDCLLTPFGSIWESLWLPLGTFGRKMEAKELP